LLIVVTDAGLAEAIRLVETVWEFIDELRSSLEFFTALQWRLTADG